jgi:NIMA (never in mitosis gene a)-related kinase
MGAAASASDDFAVFRDLRAEYESQKVESGEGVDDRALMGHFKRILCERYSPEAEGEGEEEEEEEEEEEDPPEDLDLELVMGNSGFDGAPRKESIPVLQDFTFSESTQMNSFYPFSDHPEPSSTKIHSKGSSKSSQSTNPFATKPQQRKPSRSPRIQSHQGDCECGSWNQVAAYESVRFIGRGAFAVCHLARRKNDNKFVVLKKMLSPMQLLAKQEISFLSEASLLNQMRHANIVRYFDSFVEQGFMHLVMEFADGGNLHQQILNQRALHRKSPSDSTLLFPEKQVWGWGSQIMSALDHIHSKSIVHRDIKPMNIFLSGHNQQVIKVGDFGIAKMVDGFVSSSDSASTQVEGLEVTSDRNTSMSSDNDDHDFGLPSFVGTPHYLAPELIDGDSASFAADMWAVGCVMYELCSLSRVYSGTSCIILFAAILNGAKEPLPGVYSGQLVDLVDRMLAREPAKRATLKEVMGFPEVQTALISLQNVLSDAHNSSADCAAVEEMDISQEMDRTVRGVEGVEGVEHVAGGLLVHEEALAEIAHDQQMRLEMLQWLGERGRRKAQAQ